VNTFARWKIVDPVLFLKTVGYISRAQQRLDEIIDPTVRNFITSNRLIEAVRNSNRELDTFEDLGEGVQAAVGDGGETSEEKTNAGSGLPRFSVGRDKIDTGILTQAKPKLAQFGIELVDVKIKRVNYVEEVRKSVYDRMIAERKQIAQKFRSEGKGEAQKILGEKERELKRIESEAYRTAQEIKGKADAESTRLYAEAFGLDPEFYSFVKTLEVYNEALSDNSSIILSTDSEIFKYMKGYEGNTTLNALTVTTKHRKNQKHRRTLCRCFTGDLVSHHRSTKVSLFTLSSLMPRAGQQLPVLMLAHLFSSFLDYATQQITPIHILVFA
jgi:membrane protease subunit HflC